MIILAHIDSGQRHRADKITVKTLHFMFTFAFIAFHRTENGKHSCPEILRLVGWVFLGLGFAYFGTQMLCHHFLAPKNPTEFFGK